jgi:flagellar hook protein FlgE
MLQSFYTAFTGLNAEKEWLSVISDNIANVNTVGFKSENVVFEDLLAQSLTTFKNGAPTNREIGGGVIVSSTVKDFSQGTFMSTGNPLDLALDGEGFFMVKDESGLTYYTRNGQFRLDAEGNIINMLGMKLQGWMLDEYGNVAGAIGDITIPMSVSPQATTVVAFQEPTNLDATSPFIVDNPNTSDIDESVFNPANTNTFNYVNAITVYDSLGSEHTLEYYFIHKEDSDGAYWLIYSAVDGKPAEVVDGTDKYAFVKVRFKEDGTLDLSSVESYGKITDVSSESQSESSDNGTFTLSNKPLLPGSVLITEANSAAVEWYDDGKGNLIDKASGDKVGLVNYEKGEITIFDFEENSSTDSITASYSYYDDTTGNTLDPRKIIIDKIAFDNGASSLNLTYDITKIEQVAADFVFYASQNGNAKGDLFSISVSEDGTIKASYTNGEVKDVARLSIANFSDKEMLVREGSWLYVPNTQTYTAVIMPGGNISKIRSGMLEMSNVDIASEFINLITAQRAYQANARVITTDDQILQETMNIKR